MIVYLNGINYTNLIASGIPQQTNSSTLSVLGSVFVESNLFQASSQGTGCRIKTLFTKDNTLGTTYDISLYWNTGITTTGAVKLASVVGFDGNATAVTIERNLMFNFTIIPSSKWATILTSTKSVESDISSNALTANGWEEVVYDFNNSGYYLACGQRTSGIARAYDNLVCEYLYIDR